MLCFANIGPNTCSRTIDLLGHNKLRNVSVRRVVRGNKQGTLSVLRFTLARPHLLIFVLVPLLFTNVVRVMFYVLRIVLRDTCYVLCFTCCVVRFACYVLCFTFYVLRYLAE